MSPQIAKLVFPFNIDQMFTKVVIYTILIHHQQVKNFVPCVLSVSNWDNTDCGLEERENESESHCYSYILRSYFVCHNNRDDDDIDSVDDDDDGSHQEGHDDFVQVEGQLHENERVSDKLKHDLRQKRWFSPPGRDPSSRIFTIRDRR